MNMSDYHHYILPAHEHYCIPNINEVKFISNRQTMGIVMGSCISTLFIGKKDNTFILSANHIVIAKPKDGSIVASKGAEEQIDEIIQIYNNAFQITKENILCLHIIGAGNKSKDNLFLVPQHNIDETFNVLNERDLSPIFCDTGSHFYASFSLYVNKVSAIVENKETLRHKSYIIDLNKLFQLHDLEFDKKVLPASPLQPGNIGFEYLVNKEIIIFITGKKD